MQRNGLKRLWRILQNTESAKQNGHHDQSPSSDSERFIGENAKRKPSLWKYKCLNCGERREEWVGGPQGNKKQRIICKLCSKRAVEELYGITIMTECEPHRLNGKPSVTATRFVPVRGKSIPMCEDCWGGGTGPGVERVKEGMAGTTVKELLEKRQESSPTMSLEVPSVAKAMTANGLCSCGRPKKHRGRCRGYRTSDTYKPKTEVHKHLNGNTYQETIRNLQRRRASLDDEIEKIDDLIKGLEELEQMNA